MQLPRVTSVDLSSWMQGKPRPVYSMQDIRCLVLREITTLKTYVELMRVTEGLKTFVSVTEGTQQRLTRSIKRGNESCGISSEERLSNKNRWSSSAYHVRLDQYLKGSEKGSSCLKPRIHLLTPAWTELCQGWRYEHQRFRRDTSGS